MSEVATLPAFANKLVNAALHEQRHKRWSDAQKLHRAALTVSPECGPARLNAAVCALHLGELADEARFLWDCLGKPLPAPLAHRVALLAVIGFHAYGHDPAARWVATKLAEQRLSPSKLPMLPVYLLHDDYRELQDPSWIVHILSALQHEAKRREQPALASLIAAYTLRGSLAPTRRGE